MHLFLIELVSGSMYPHTTNQYNIQYIGEHGAYWNPGSLKHIWPAMMMQHGYVTVHMLTSLTMNCL